MRIHLNFAILLLLTAFVPGSSGEEKPREVFSVTVSGTGRPMILIPGLSCSGNVWDGTVARFKDRYECHVMTLAGFAGQPAIGEPMLEQIRDGLSRYIRDQKLERPVIVGHSLGAFMAFWLGATIPDQIGQIVAVDGVPYFPGLLDRKATPESVNAMAKGIRSMYGGQKREQFEMAMRISLRGMVTDEKDFERVLADSLKSAPKAVAQALYELMTIDLRQKVSAIQVPVLIVGASAMATTPEQKKSLEDNYRAQVATIPQHEVIFAPKARHFIQLDEPAFLFGEMERFLKTNNGKRN
ncbi:pimeloyl-ACP methyl ester carboxylesterase [Prosthecobacter fusiformis]|uniref:Pimeloyl-ACP methyl ester carboxylesterase n=1 Tax=Prosthecobacter fusiformis TaxID=48464 RepID=A0A4R7RWB7_9BACT|nr:alpha/beta hydrolase [Prosthecobacter fusiformis]TDU69246.1 pimeloyl-ACP methyl ester carboxylesterase [Prosthecobacter fusiformis]